MRELTDTLFDYAKALDESAPLVLSSVRACDVLADVLAGMYPQFLERGWTPELHIEDEEVLIEANAEALSRVFSNVLTNAVRYGADAPCIVQRSGGGSGLGLAIVAQLCARMGGSATAQVDGTVLEVELAFKAVPGASTV